MGDQLQNWISNKNFEIIGKIDGKQEKSGSKYRSITLDLIKIQEIKVYLSPIATIESDVLKSDKMVTIEALKISSDTRLRQTALNRLNGLIKESSEALELLEVMTTNATLKVSRRRVQNLLKTLEMAINEQIFDYQNEFGFKDFIYSKIKASKSDSFLLKMTYELIGYLTGGSPFQLIVDAESALFGSFVMDLLEKSGFESGIDLIVVDNQTMDKLKANIRPNDSPIVVVFESADIDSAVHRLIKTYINETFGSINVFVQQSVYKRFCEVLRARSTNSIMIGDRMDINSDVISKLEFNCEAIDFDIQTTGIQVFKFRTNEEIKTLVKHFVDIPFVRLWTEKTSLAIEFAKSVDSSSLFYVNDSSSVPSLTASLSTKTSDKTELNLFHSQKRLAFDSILSANKKWKAIPPEERLKIIRNFLLTNRTSVSMNISALEAFNHKVIQSRDNLGFQMTLKDYESIGLVGLRIGDRFDDRIFTQILEALISGNSLIINSSKRVDDLIELSQHLSSLGYDCIDFLRIDDKDVMGNTILTFGGQSVGLYLQDLQQISRKSFIKLSKTIIQSFGDISFAK